MVDVFLELSCFFDDPTDVGNLISGSLAFCKSKLRKEYVKAVYCYPAYLTYMKSTSCKNARLDEAQAGIKNDGRNINNLRYADDTTLMAESKELKSLLMKVKESEKLA